MPSWKWLVISSDAGSSVKKQGAQKYGTTPLITPMHSRQNEARSVGLAASASIVSMARSCRVTPPM